MPRKLYFFLVRGKSESEVRYKQHSRSWEKKNLIRMSGAHCRWWAVT